MIASTVNAAYCAIVLTAFWSLLGFAFARCVLPAGLAMGAAPILGWAVHSALSLPVLTVFGLSLWLIVGIGASCFAGSIAALTRRQDSDDENILFFPWWAFIVAAAIALIPAAAVAPKIATESVQLADPIFDHSKIAMIDAMARLGLPPVNPFFGENGEAGRLVYYYLYYFSAAQAALVLHVSGWESDIAMTWFSAFSSLSLMMGLAVWFSGRASASLWSALLILGTSLRDFLAMVIGSERVDSILAKATGFAGWLFQAAWVPQHLVSASCVVLALLLLWEFCQRQTLMRGTTLAFVVVAGFESSTYVGGVTLALTVLFATPFILMQIDASKRVGLVLNLGLVALLVLSMAVPFILAQLATVGQRGAGNPIILHHFDVLSESIPETLRRILDLPAYWLVLLPIEFPAIYVAGVLSFYLLLRNEFIESKRKTLMTCAVLAAVGTSISWLLIGDLGGNNDLGMRAVLPSIMVLTAAAATGVTMKPRRTAIVVVAFGGFLLSAPHTLDMARYNFAGNSGNAGRTFAQTPKLWAAVRRHTEPDRRVGNNPLFLKDMTPWPVNISWALLADRSSCFAASELVLAYAPMPQERREAIYAQFIRVFEGKGTQQDISDLATRYGCDVVVVTAQDGAWSADPFAASSLYRPVESDSTLWRIYKKNTTPQ